MLKISAGKFKGRRLKAPAGLSTRPTQSRVRRALFDRLLHGGLDFDWADIRVLDLFSGTGALGLEALSRGACSVTFCEKSPSVIKILAENVKNLGVFPSVQIIGRECCAFLESTPPSSPYHLVFCDAPYDRSPLVEKILSHLDSHAWMMPLGTVVLEMRSTQELTLPVGLSVEERRTYGGTQLLFLKKSGLLQNFTEKNFEED